MLSAEAVFPHIQHIYKECLIELFKGLECEIEQVTDLDREPIEAPIARIDCGSNEMEVTIHVRIPMAVLALTYPIPDIIDIDEAELEDWIAEISNQLIGKIKARLIQHECDVKIGLPSAFFGASLAELLPANAQSAEFYYEIDNEPCETVLSLETFEETVSFNPDAQEEDDPFADSEFEMF